MANPYYDHGSVPATGSTGSSSAIRAELDAVEAGFDKLPTLSGFGNKAVVVNAGGTALTTSAGSLSLGTDLTTTGGAVTLTMSGATNVTLPTTGTLATVAGTEVLTNKTLNLTSNTLTGTIAQFNTACSDADFATLAGSETLTNKTLNLTSNTLTGTFAQFNTACSDANFVRQAEADVYVATVGGTADVITLTPVDAISGYADGQRFRFIATGTNTGPATIAVSGLSAISVLRSFSMGNSSAGSIVAGEISTGQMITVVYRNGSFQLIPYAHPVWQAWPVDPSVGGSATYTSRNATFAIFGPMVAFQLTMTINAIGTGSPIQISNFPINTSGTSVFAVYWDGAASSIVTCVGVLSGTTLTLYSLTAAGATLTTANNIMQNGTTIYVSGSYLGA